MVSLGKIQQSKSEVFHKIFTSINYGPDRWIKFYVYKTGSTRLHPIRFDNTIVFLECNVFNDEIGYVDFMLLAHEKEFHIDYFEVHSPYQRQGYGREIYDWIEHYAKRKGLQTINLTPYKSAVNFWMKMGFLPISHDSDEMMKTIKSQLPYIQKDDSYVKIAS